MEVDEQSLDVLTYVRDRNIVADRRVYIKPRKLPVLGQQGHAASDRVGGRVDLDLFAVDEDLAGIGPGYAEDRLHQLGSTRAHEAGDPQNLAPLHAEADVPELLSRNIPDVQHGLADLDLLLVEHLGKLATYHLLDEGALGERGRWIGAYVFSVAENGDLIGDPEHLVHLVRYVDHGAALLAQRSDDPKQSFHFRLGDRRSRLVHDDQTRFIGNCLRNLHQLNVRDAELDHLFLGIEFYLETIEKLPRVLVHPFHVDQTVPFDFFTPEKNIFGDRHVRDGAQFLVDHRNALREGEVRVGNVELFSPERDRAGIGNVNADQTFHERGFACSVLAHEGVHGSLADVEPDVIQGANARELLGDIFHAEQIFFTHSLSLPSIFSWLVASTRRRAIRCCYTRITS